MRLSREGGSWNLPATSVMNSASLLPFLCICALSLRASRGTGFAYKFPAPRHASVEQSAASPRYSSRTPFRNWCQYTVSKTVSCQVHNGTTSLVQRMFQSCRWPGPCSNRISDILKYEPKYMDEKNHAICQGDVNVYDIVSLLACDRQHV